MPVVHLDLCFLKFQGCFAQNLVWPCKAPWGHGVCSSPETPPWCLSVASLRWPPCTADGAPSPALWWTPATRKGKELRQGRDSSTRTLSLFAGWRCGKRRASLATEAHLVEKVPELLLSLDDLLPVLYLLVFHMLLLQSAAVQTHEHIAMLFLLRLLTVKPAFSTYIQFHGIYRRPFFTLWNFHYVMSFVLKPLKFSISVIACFCFTCTECRLF